MLFCATVTFAPIQLLACQFTITYELIELNGIVILKSLMYFLPCKIIKIVITKSISLLLLTKLNEIDRMCDENRKLIL